MVHLTHSDKQVFNNHSLRLSIKSAFLVSCAKLIYIHDEKKSSVLSIKDNRMGTKLIICIRISGGWGFSLAA